MASPSRLPLEQALPPFDAEIVERMHIGIAVWGFLDPAHHSPDDLVLLAANDAAGRIAREPFAPLIGKRRADTTAHRLLDPIYLQVMETRQPVTIPELEIADGTAVWSINVFPLEGRRVALAFQDVTEASATRAALRQSEQSYRSIFESSHDAILILAPEDGRVVAANGGALALYGEGIVGSPVSLLAESPERSRKHIDATMASGSSRFESVQRVADGTRRHFEINADVIEYDGRPAILSINRDITDRVNAARELAETQRQQLAAADFGRRAVLTAGREAMLRDACETIGAVLGVDSCTALWHDRDSGVFRYAAQSGIPLGLPVTSPTDRSNLSGYAYAADGPVVFDELVEVTAFGGPVLLAAGIRSGISAPLHGHTTRYGVISALTRTPRRFTPQESAFVQTMASLAAEAVDRLEAERALHRRQQQLADAQAVGHVGSFELDLATGIFEFSDELYRICGLEPQSQPMTIASVSELLAPGREPYFRASLAALREGGTTDQEHPLLRGDGSRRTIHTRAQGFVDPVTGRARAIGIMQDVTEQRAAQAAIDEREARLQLIISRLPVIIWSTDTSLRISSVIGAGFNAISEERLEDLNLHVDDIVGPPPREAGSLFEALAGQSVTYDTHSGARELRVHIEALRDGTGAITGTVGIAFDRTEQQRTERVLGNIAYGAVSKIGDDFFRSAVLGLANVLHVDGALIARLEPDGNDLRTIAVARDGEILTGDYYLPGSLAQGAPSQAVAWIDNAQRAFPHATALRELEGIGYAGISIAGTTGEPVGLVAILHRDPLRRDAATEAALRIYADRAAVELERVNHERTLVDAKEYVENLIDSANVVIIEVDADGSIRLVNHAFELLTGRTRHEVEGLPLLEVLRDTSPGDYLITSGQHELEAAILTDSGELRLLQLRANDVRRYGRAVGTILFGLDITEARRVEREQQRLQQQVERAADEWRNTFDSVLTPILLVDSGGRVARMNRAVAGVTGRPIQAMLGVPLTSLGHGEPWYTAAAMLAHSAAMSESGAPEATAEVRDDDGRTWTINIMPLYAPHAAGSSVVVLWDITRIVALQESLRLNEQMSVMGQLVAGVAHEVRNPLFGISAALDAFEEEFGNSADFGEYIVRLRSDADRLRRLMNDLLEYGRPAELKMALQPFPLIIERSVMACAPMARAKNVAVRSRVARPLPDVLVDGDRLEQVLKNVIENAISFSAAGSSVDLDTYATDGVPAQLICTITDRGPGFRTDDLANVFTPFFTRRRGGTGLGLSIVQRIIGDHGGSVAARNADEGGAVVELRLPIPEHRRF